MHLRLSDKTLEDFALSIKDFEVYCRLEINPDMQVWVVQFRL